MSEITGKIENVSESKSGKSLRVKVGDLWLGANKKSGLDKMRGDTVKITYSEGDFGPWVDEWSHSDHAPETPSAPSRTPKDRSIFVQALAKSTLSPDMSDDEIERRCHFLWNLHKSLEAWD